MLELVVDEMEQQVQDLVDNQRKIQATQATILKELNTLSKKVDELTKDKNAKVQVTPAAISSWDVEDDDFDAYDNWSCYVDSEDDSSPCTEISPDTYGDLYSAYPNKHPSTSYTHHSNMYSKHHSSTHAYVNTPSSILYGHHSSMQANTPSDGRNTYPLQSTYSGSHTNAHYVHNPPVHQPPPSVLLYNLPIKLTTKDNPLLSSEAVNFNGLLAPEMVKQKYPKLRGPDRASELAVKLAVEAFFGPDVLARCTVAGCRSLPGLPVEQLQKLKQFIFLQTPQFWDTPCDFDREVWSTCTISINQKCKSLRKASSSKE